MSSWPPTSLADLESGIANGLLTESHSVDLKRELPAPPKNQGIAADLAAFSIDGGLIFVGVDEETLPVTISPVPFAGLAERIEQIGLNVDPPVKVRTIAIQVDATPPSGVLVIVIPPSPNAPHMVGGQYRARNDKTNYVMGDAEVWRVRDALRDHLDEMDELLEDFARSAMPTHGGDGPLLLAVARPVSGRPDTLLICAADKPFDWITSELLNGPLTQDLKPRWFADFTRGLRVAHRANGWAITYDSEAVLDLEIHEDGTLRLRAGDFELVDGPARAAFVNDLAVNGLVKRVVMTAAQIGRLCAYFGAWDFAVSLAPLKGQRSAMAREGRQGQMSRARVIADMPPYSEDAYHESTAATFEELADDADAIVLRLLGRLNRSFAGPSAQIPQ